MNNLTNSERLTPGLTLPLSGVRPYLIQALLVSSAVVLPAIAHISGLPVRWLLPMHWPVLLAGLIYGWRSGLAVGLLAPAVNWMFTGFPLPAVIPAMTVELAVYGVVTGYLVEKSGWNRFSAVAAALITGRILFLVTILATGGYSGIFSEYFIAAILPGLVAGSLQIGTLPLLAEKLVDKRNRT